MTIVAKIGGDKIYIPFEFRSKGLFKKTYEKHQDFKDLASTIDYCKRHNENYEGLVDHFEFEIDGKSIQLMTKLTYEEIFTWNPIKEGQHFFGKKDEGTWEFRKFIRTSSENMTVYKNPEGSEYKMDLGHPDPVIDVKILYDIILYSLAHADNFLQGGDTKNFKKTIEAASSMLNVARKTHAIEDWNDFNQIIEHYERSLK